MFKLYCLSYHYKVRWSFSNKFYCFSDLVKWLHDMKFVSFWGDDTKYYKVVSPAGNIQYIEIIPALNRYFNYSVNVSLGYICNKLNLNESLLK